MSILNRILGKPLASHEAEEQKIGVVTGVPTLGLDGLSSAAYGPEAALTVLLPLGALGLAYIGPITLVILLLLAVLYFSYRQTISAYPQGGGSYTVAKENLGSSAGLLAAAALLLDYILNVAVGISAGIGALVSAFPSLHSHIVALCLLTLAIITIINLRGVRESGIAFGLPTYLFVISLLVIIVIGIYKTIASGGHPLPVVAPPPIAASMASVSLWLLLRSFASGCTAMTGVEAVSNGVTAFASPAVKNAERTLTAIVVILAVLLGGIAFLSKVYAVGAMDQTQPDYQSVISQLITAVVGRGILYYISIGSVLAVLALSANTSFAGFPRLCRLLALDDYLPHSFTNLGRRLVYTVGILVLAFLSGVLLIIFGGITDRLIPLFAVGAFGAFTLSQAGMVIHWQRNPGKGAQSSKLINGVGAVATGAALIIILAAKFLEGAWITILIIPALIFLFGRVKRHYEYVAKRIENAGALDLSQNESPVVIIPIKGWDLPTERAMRFGLRLSPEVFAVHFKIDEDEKSDVLKRQWAEKVETPVRAAGITVPRLLIIDCPYRQIFKPLLEYIKQIQKQYPNRIIAVIIPELVESHWYQYLLHNQRASWLKVSLLMNADRKVVVINTPWYLD